ncbi:MAG: hypothetical protein KF764_03045 [Labilithrix sp.]|nr:hypothetical protein [Labilithrix sp.]
MRYLPLVTLFSLGLLLPGCMSKQEEPKDPTRVTFNKEGKVTFTKDGHCTWLDSQRRRWGWIAAGSGVLAGGGVAVSQSVPDEEKNAAGRLTLTTTFLAFGALAAASTFLATDYSQTARARGCVTIEGIPKANSNGDGNGDANGDEAQTDK